jgi:hypothetical protein
MFFNLEMYLQWSICWRSLFDFMDCGHELCVGLRPSHMGVPNRIHDILTSRCVQGSGYSKRNLKPLFVRLTFSIPDCRFGALLASECRSPWPRHFANPIQSTSTAGSINSIIAQTIAPVCTALNSEQSHHLDGAGFALPKAVVEWQIRRES